MTIQEIEALAFKDALVAKYRFQLLQWDSVIWIKALANMRKEFKALSVGEQAKIRMRYMT